MRVRAKRFDRLKKWTGCFASSQTPFQTLTHETVFWIIIRRSLRDEPNTALGIHAKHALSLDRRSTACRRPFSLSPCLSSTPIFVLVSNWSKWNQSSSPQPRLQISRLAGSPVFFSRICTLSCSFIIHPKDSTTYKSYTPCRQPRSLPLSLKWLMWKV